MPPGRSSKRTGESADGNSSDEQTSKTKSQRTQRGSTQNDFSSVVKSKLQSYTRTGQACDRCKVRKIRCDALPEGCSHCISQNLECYVTDRVTGRTERRGYTQELEREKTAMMAQIRTLERMLETNGIHITRFQWPQSFDSPRRSSSRSNYEAGSQDISQQPSHLSTPVPPSSPFSPSESNPTNAPRGGASSSRPHLVSFKSLTLSILGNSIDLGSFEEINSDDVPVRGLLAPPDYSLSEATMLHTMLNFHRPTPVDLPPWSEGLQYAEWWFNNLYPFVPIVHKPTFFASLRALYDNPHSASLEPADLVSIHMVLATTLRQVSGTSMDHSKRSHLHSWSDKHFYYALGKLHDLVVSRTLKDCQALALVLFHATRYSKPRISALVASQALALAMELNLHRGDAATAGQNNLQKEMRKRIWWAILWLATTVHGRLRRPMPIGLQDMDVGYPEPVSDESLEYQGVDDRETTGCPFLVGLWIMKATKMFLYMHSTIYSVRSKSSEYIHSIRILEKELKRWREGLPTSLRLLNSDVTNAENGDFHALFIHYISLNFQLYLRHPMVTPVDDPTLVESTLHASEDNCKELLKCLLALRKIRSLEGTWFSLGTYTTGAFLHLISYWQKRNEMREVDLLELRQDMISWSTIISDASHLIGNGQRLSSAVNDIIHRVLVWIDHDRHDSGSESGPSQASQEPLEKTPHRPPYMPTMPPVLASQGIIHPGSRSSPFAVPPRPGFYPDPSAPDSSVYGQPMSFPGTHVHSSSTAEYSANEHFMYEGHMRLDQPHGHGHTPGPGQGAGTTMQSYAPGQTSAIPQAAHPAMWRPHSSTSGEHQLNSGIGLSGSGSSQGGSSWQEWNTAMGQGGQDHRYGSHQLMNMAQAQPHESRPEGGISTSTEMDMGMGPDVSVPSDTLPWPGVLYPGSAERQPGP